MENIILTGFMGTGKSVVGNKIAEKLGWKFIDTDKIIESTAGKTINKIFLHNGERIFRKHESNAIRMITHLKNYVISTGGGAVLNEENVSNMKQTGVIVLLTAKPEVIFERLKDDSTRPLLNCPDPYLKIKNLLKQRHPFYIKAADISIDASSLSVDEVVQKIFKEIEERKIILSEMK